MSRKKVNRKPRPVVEVRYTDHPADVNRQGWNGIVSRKVFAIANPGQSKSPW